MIGHVRNFLFATVVVIASYYFRNVSQYVWGTYIDSLSKIVQNEKGIKVFTQEELSRFNGDESTRLYLAVLGKVYDVSKGTEHYAKGAPYNYFTGKDGSRALITGDFYDESKNKDHVLDLKCNDILNLVTWQDTFTEKYIYIGLLNGRYYDDNGHETTYTKELLRKVDTCKTEKELDKKKDIEYPPCNIAWNPEEGTKVWCTKSSGGITRNWIGVPRQLFAPGKEKPSCVCVNLKKNHSQVKFKEYDKCDSEAASCVVDTET